MPLRIFVCSPFFSFVSITLFILFFEQLLPINLPYFYLPFLILGEHNKDQKIFRAHAIDLVSCDLYFMNIHDVVLLDNRIIIQTPLLSLHSWS